ncbi:MAG: hypothetical protein PVF87_02845 [Acidimicrobiia bacterium]|jgi:hypothetical protein
MLSRLLLTAASLTVAAASAALFDCSVAAVEILGGDPVGLCNSAESLGISGEPYVALGLAVVAVLSLAWTWVPALRPGERRRRRSPERILEKNLGRIADVGYAESRFAAEPSDRESLADLRRRLEAIEISLQSDTPSRETTVQWMALLREANDKHNEGELATEDFKVINTRLLDLFTEPREAVSA